MTDFRQSTSDSIMKEKLHLTPHHHFVTSKDRNKLNGHKSLVVWFTGLSGSGKSTIASRLEQLLIERKIRTYILDGDNIRTGLNKSLTFSKADRTENLRRIAEVSKLFVDAGVVVLSAFISPLKIDRESVKNIVGKGNFAEIYVATSLKECERRDVKGLYKKARKGEISNFTGLSAPYEPPEDPDLIIYTEGKSVDHGAKAVLNFLIDDKKITRL